MLNIVKNIFEEIVEFWMCHNKNWFKPTLTFDNLCSNKYSSVYETYQTINLLENKSKRILGKIILLDQLSRNIFRDKSYAYKYDQEAIDLVYSNINLLNQLNGWEKIFFLMPLKHSENILDQEYNIKLWENIIKTTNKTDLKVIKLYQRNLKTSFEHFKVIKKFGRFPKRNILLKRKSTKEEINYLKNNTSFI